MRADPEVLARAQHRYDTMEPPGDPHADEFDRWCEDEGREGSDEDRAEFDLEVAAAIQDAAADRAADEARWR